MNATPLEERVRERLGFYPSYLGALESTPDAARLVWEETERALTAPWSVNRGRWLGDAATATIEDHLPPSVTARLNRVTFDEPNLKRTVEFFAFVLLRLGIGISAVRYALDGTGTRLDHRIHAPSAAAPERNAPTHWDEGAATDLPADPQFSLVQPDAAPAHVSATYRYLTEALGTPNVNNIFQAFGSDPAFLTAVVDAQIAAGTDETDLARELRGLYAASLNVDDEPGAFTASDVDAVHRAAVTDKLGTFHDNLPTLLVTLYLGTRIVTAED